MATTPFGEFMSLETESTIFSDGIKVVMKRFQQKHRQKPRVEFPCCPECKSFEFSMHCSGDRIGNGQTWKCKRCGHIFSEFAYTAFLKRRGQPEFDSKTLAQEARDWVASPDGQAVIKKALEESQQVTEHLNALSRFYDGASTTAFYHG